MESVRRALVRGLKGAVITVRSVSGSPPSRQGMQLGVQEDGATHGSLGCDGFDRAGREDGLRAIAEASSFESTYPWDEGSSIAVEVRFFAPGDVIHRDPVEIAELLVVGRGPVARSLIAIGEAMGYHVRVAAGPEASVGELDGADEVIITPDARAVEALHLGPNTYVVICGHDTEFSQPVLRALLRSSAPYIGMMGSRRHTGHLYEELRDRGFSESELERVHSPVGLDIGAETPEEIALSALSQIVAVRRGGGGGHLDGA